MSKDIIEKIIALKTAKESYEKVPEDKLNVKNIDLKLISSNPTIKIYQRVGTNQIVIAIRGTKVSSRKDLISDIYIAIQNLHRTDRYKEDFNFLQKFFKIYSPDKYVFYLSSHSLGSAIAQEFLKEFPFIKKSTHFNGALQRFTSKTRPYNNKIDYHYFDKDFLYNTVGNFVPSDSNLTVHKYQPTNVERFGMFLMPSLYKVKLGLKAHSLKNFDNVIK